MMFFELPKGWDQYFSTQDNQLVQGICVLKSNPFTFWYFCPKNGPKWPNKGPKMSWFGMVYFSMARLWSWIMAEPKNSFKIVQNIYAKSLISGSFEVTLKLNTEGSCFFLFLYRQVWITTLPNQDILGPFSGLFGPFLGQKYQKVNGFNLRTHIPLTNE